MLRPILPHAAWQAIAALAGFFTLVFALAAPVDLWRITVKSHQGEPFLAFATLASLPEERISDDCLSMGPESDAPGSEGPFLSKANLKLDAARNVVEISTAEPIFGPSLALVLRVQCAGAPIYARHFFALIPPAIAGTQRRPSEHLHSGMQPMQRPGFRLSLLPGDTVESVASVIFPGDRGRQQALVQQVIAGNPNIFQNGRIGEVGAGTVLWFPDLREIRTSTQAESPVSTKADAGTDVKRRSRRGAATPPPESAHTDVAEVEPAKPRNPVTLRRALELGDRPGPQECKQLMQLCGAETQAVVPVAPGLEEKARGLESGVKELHLKQDSIDLQLQRLEQSLQSLQKSISSAPAPVPPAPSPPKVEIRTVVKAEPISWTIWLSLASLIIAAAIGGFAYGRRGSLSRGLTESDEQLDRMLATAANVMREFESTPAPATASKRAEHLALPTAKSPPRSRPAPPPEPQPAEVSPASADYVSEEPPAAESRALDVLLDAEAVEPTTGLDLELESELPAAPDATGLSNNVLYEMDQALDNTRSMFTDVDRFIALGRTQNALSLLQFQVHKDPQDRDSWIKLMAIYRQEKMDAELAKAAREFRSQFPDENTPGA